MSPTGSADTTYSAASAVCTGMAPPLRGLAIDILVRGSGSLFDPDVAEAAVPVFLISRNAEERRPTIV